MPLRFESAATEDLFWLFFALFLAATAAYLVLAFLKRKERNFLKALPMLFFGSALVCLAPQFPLIYCSCYLAAVGEARSVKDDPYLFTLGAAVLVCSQLLLLTQMLELTADVPLYAYFTIAALELTALYAYFIIATLVLHANVGGFFLRRQQNPVYAVARMVYSYFPLLNLAFAAALLADGPLLGEVFLFVGCVYFAAGDVIDRGLEMIKHRRRDFIATVPCIIGQVCSYLGLILALMAA